MLSREPSARAIENATAGFELPFDRAIRRMLAHLGRRLADQALEQDIIGPDEARRRRGEADFLTSRALKLAPDGDEIKKLRDEVFKLLELKTN